MIKTFRCAETESLFNGARVRRFVNNEAVARRKPCRSSEWQLRALHKEQKRKEERTNDNPVMTLHTSGCLELTQRIQTGVLR
jgi:hypothetical protein